MLTELYLKTTNPKLSFSDLLESTTLFSIILSVVFHTIIYTSFVNIVSFIFLVKLLEEKVNIRLIIFLLIVMFFGFFARFFHVKEIFKAYQYNIEKTRDHLDKLYITWIFIS